MVATTTVHVRTDEEATTYVQPCMCPPVQILYTLHVLTSKTKLNATRGENKCTRLLFGSLSYPYVSLCTPHDSYLGKQD